MENVRKVECKTLGARSATALPQGALPSMPPLLGEYDSVSSGVKNDIFPLSCFQIFFTIYHSLPSDFRRTPKAPSPLFDGRWGPYATNIPSRVGIETYEESAGILLCRLRRIICTRKTIVSRTLAIVITTPGHCCF